MGLWEKPTTPQKYIKEGYKMDSKIKFLQDRIQFRFRSYR